MTKERFRRRIGVLIAAASLAAGVMACSGPDESNNSAGPSSSSASSPSSSQSNGGQSDVDYTAAVQKISTDGTDKVPIHWRVPNIEDEETRAAVMAAQRWQTLYFIAISEQQPASLLALSPVVASQVAQDQLKTKVERSGDEIQAGPVWAWADTPERGGELVTVQICVDEGWNTPKQDRRDRPEPHKFRSTAYTFDLKDDLASEGVSRWKVQRVTQATDAFEQSCDQWANHAPKGSG